SCFFANYFFGPIPKKGPELSKYNLAAALFEYMGFLTSYHFRANEYYITNLCNEELNHAPSGKTVLIPQDIASNGINEIRKILNLGNFEMIFALSQQVNYWLQYFSLYSSSELYLKNSHPKPKGLQKGYYEPTGKAPFLDICGKQFMVGSTPLFPVLHVKQFPLKGSIQQNYQPHINSCINSIKELTKK
ncbi:MAG: hypothetical protein Q8M08_07380, partial [Bacteroidales bacterium]|nr:hypothetical protein [Bacteroidales bacterium]